MYKHILNPEQVYFLMTQVSYAIYFGEVPVSLVCLGVYIPCLGIYFSSYYSMSLLRTITYY